MGFFIMDKQDDILKALTGEEDWWDRLFHVNESPDEYITRKGLDKAKNAKKRPNFSSTWIYARNELAMVRCDSSDVDESLNSLFAFQPRLSVVSFRRPSTPTLQSAVILASEWIYGAPKI
jgi:hypothetical protein